MPSGRDFPTRAPGEDTDPVDALRLGWTNHMRFGLTAPALSVLLYGRIRPGVPGTITAPAAAHIRRILDDAVRTGLLPVPQDDAADRIIAANVGGDVDAHRPAGGEP